LLEDHDMLAPSYEKCNLRLKGSHYLTKISKYELGCSIPVETTMNQILMSNLVVVQDRTNYLNSLARNRF
jgi:hypothetical protein